MKNYRTVPWFDSAEWLRVYSALFGPSATAASKRAVLETLLAWKLRQPSLVSGVESTLSLLEVEAQVGAETNDRILRLAYSAAIMRFVNHMLDTEHSKGLTLYRAAKKADLPDWMIDMRHSAAHGDSLPSLDLLRRAASVGLDWLRRNYWNAQKDSISDYIVGEKTITEDNERRLSQMISFCASINICSRTEPRIKYLHEIPDPEMRESILNEARELFDSDLSNPDITLNELVTSLRSQSSKLMKSCDPSAVIYQTLLEGNSLFLSLDVLRMFDEKLFTKNGLCKSYLRSWDILLEMLHTYNLLGGFVEQLVSVTADPERLDAERKLAALWIREIICGLRRSKMYMARLKKLKASGKLDSVYNKKKNHKTLFGELFPNEKDALTLNLTKSIPEEFCTLAFIKPIIKSCNPYLHIFIKDLLSLQQPRLNSAKEEKLCKIAEIISGKNISGKTKQVYTLDNVIHETESNDRSSDSDCVLMDVEEFDTGVWKLAPAEHDWSKCPIGVLPWQLRSVTI